MIRKKERREKLNLDATRRDPTRLDQTRQDYEIKGEFNEETDYILR